MSQVLCRGPRVCNCRFWPFFLGILLLSSAHRPHPAPTSESDSPPYGSYWVISGLDVRPLLQPVMVLDGARRQPGSRPSAFTSPPCPLPLPLPSGWRLSGWQGDWPIKNKTKGELWIHYLSSRDLLLTSSNREIESLWSLCSAREGGSGRGRDWWMLCGWRRGAQDEGFLRGTCQPLPRPLAPWLFLFLGT